MWTEKLKLNKAHTHNKSIAKKEHWEQERRLWEERRKNMKIFDKRTNEITWIPRASSNEKRVASLNNKRAAARAKALARRCCVARATILFKFAQTSLSLWSLLCEKNVYNATERANEIGILVAPCSCIKLNIPHLTFSEAPLAVCVCASLLGSN